MRKISRLTQADEDSNRSRRMVENFNWANLSDDQIKQVYELLNNLMMGNLS